MILIAPEPKVRFKPVAFKTEDVRCISSTEKRERSNACAQTQQCYHGIDVVGEKQSKSFSENFHRRTCAPLLFLSLYPSG